MGRARLFAAVAAAMLVSAAPAGAATPRFLGTGHDPSVAVDQNGTAHVAWPSEQNGNTLEYCQVPRHGKTCTQRHSFPLTESGAGHPQVLVRGPGLISIVQPDTPDRIVVFTSADNGITWAGALAGSVNTLEEAVVGPGDAFSLISGTGPAEVATYGFTGVGPAEPNVHLAEATEALDTSLTAHEGRLAAFFAGSGRLRMFQWNGLGDPNQQEMWIEGRALGDDTSSPSAVTGPSGTFMAYVVRDGARTNTYVRKVTGMKYGKLRRVNHDDPVELAFAEGPKGNLALVWRGLEAAKITRSRNGRHWTKPKRLFRGREPEDMRAALGPRGGWMVWDASGGNQGSNPIRIVALPGRPRR
jgi:hypothetical protein